MKQCCSHATSNSGLKKTTADGGLAVKKTVHDSLTGSHQGLPWSSKRIWKVRKTFKNEV